MNWSMIATVIFLNVPEEPPKVTSQLYPSLESCTNYLDILPKTFPKNFSYSWGIDKATKQRFLLMKNPEFPNSRTFVKCIKNVKP